MQLLKCTCTDRLSARLKVPRKSFPKYSPACILPTLGLENLTVIFKSFPDMSEFLVQPVFDLEITGAGKWPSYREHYQLLMEVREEDRIPNCLFNPDYALSLKNFLPTDRYIFATCLFLFFS